MMLPSKLVRKNSSKMMSIPRLVPLSLSLCVCEKRNYFSLIKNDYSNFEFIHKGKILQNKSGVKNINLKCYSFFFLSPLLFFLKKFSLVLGFEVNKKKKKNTYRLLSIQVSSAKKKKN